MQVAVAAGLRSVHAFPLRPRGQVIGALGVFNARTGRLTVGDATLVQALANIATVGVLQERAVRDGEVLARQLQGALSSRVVIEQAKGVLAQSLRISVDDAFARLRSHARRNGLRLSDLTATSWTTRKPLAVLGHQVGDTTRVIGG